MACRCQAYIAPPHLIPDPVDADIHYEVEMIREFLLYEDRSRIVGGADRIENASLHDVSKMFNLLLAIGELDFLDLNGVADEWKQFKLDAWAKPLLAKYLVAMGMGRKCEVEAMDLVQARAAINAVVEVLGLRSEGASFPEGQTLSLSTMEVDDEMDLWLVEQGSQVALPALVLLGVEAAEDGGASTGLHEGDRIRDVVLGKQKLQIERRS